MKLVLFKKYQNLNRYLKKQVLTLYFNKWLALEIDR